MYPYDFTPIYSGLNPEEVFVVMPFVPQYDQIYTDLVEPAVDCAAKSLSRQLRAYRTKGDLRTTSGWIEVMEHLYHSAGRTWCSHRAGERERSVRARDRARYAANSAPSAHSREGLQTDIRHKRPDFYAILPTLARRFRQRTCGSHPDSTSRVEG